MRKLVLIAAIGLFGLSLTSAAQACNGYGGYGYGYSYGYRPAYYGYNYRPAYYGFRFNIPSIVVSVNRVPAPTPPSPGIPSPTSVAPAPAPAIPSPSSTVAPAPAPVPAPAPSRVAFGGNTTNLEGAAPPAARNGNVTQTFGQPGR